MKKCLIILLIFNQLQLKSQDAVFSQINESPVILNPANAGSQYDIRTNLNFRQQWRSVTDPYITIAVSADAKLFSKNSSSSSSLGLGLFVLNDKAGIAKLNNFKSGLIIAGKVPIASNQNISSGISLAFSQTHIDLSALSWDKQYDGLNYNPDLPSGETFISERTQNIDLGVGVQWSYGKGATTLSSNDNFAAQAGISVFHINKPNYDFITNDKAYIRTMIHTTVSFGVENSNIQFSPSMYFTFQGPSKMLYLGNFVKYKLQESSKYTDYILARLLNVGIFYRWRDAIVLIGQVELGQYALAISYDINVSTLSKVSYGRGGFEISIKYLPIRSSSSSRLI